MRPTRCVHHLSAHVPEIVEIHVDTEYGRESCSPAVCACSPCVDSVGVDRAPGPTAEHTPCLVGGRGGGAGLWWYFAWPLGVDLAGRLALSGEPKCQPILAC